MSLVTRSGIGLVFFALFGCADKTTSTASRSTAACHSDSDCSAGASGHCDPSPVDTANAWCSYADPTCPNGRFAADAGDGLANTCVPTSGSDASVDADSGSLDSESDVDSGSHEAAADTDAGPSNCGAVTELGVCQSDSTLLYCDPVTHMLATKDCRGSGPPGVCKIVSTSSCATDSDCPALHRCWEFACLRATCAPYDMVYSNCAAVRDRGLCVGDIRQFCVAGLFSYQDCTVSGGASTGNHCTLDPTLGSTGSYVCK